MQSGQTKNGFGLTVSACLWLGLFPLLHFGSYAHITRDKWILMLILTGVSFLGFLTDLFMKRLSRPRLLPLLLGAGLLLWVIISCIASPYGPELWWIGASPRREGLVTQLCYLALFFLFSFSRISHQPVIFSAVSGVFAFLVIVLLQRAGQNPFGLYPAGRSYLTNYEFQGPIGNIDMDVGYLLLLFGLLLPIVPSAVRSRRVYVFLPLTGLAVCLFLLITMGVQFGLLTLIALAAAALLYCLPTRLRLPALLLLLILALVVVWFWPGQSGGLWELHEILHCRSQLSFGSNRIALWTYSLSLAGSDRLFLGSGSDTFALRFNTFLQQEGLSMPRRQGALLLPTYFDNPHCEYLAHLLNHGLPALFLFTALILAALFSGKQKSVPSLSRRCAVFCYAVQALLSFSVCSVAPMFWVMLGLASAREKKQDIPPASPVLSK